MQKQKTFRSKAFLDFIRAKRCQVCGKPPPSHAHHEPFKRGFMGGKAPDTFTIAMCWRCHRRRHDVGFGFWMDKTPHEIIAKNMLEYMGKILLLEADLETLDVLTEVIRQND